MNEFSYFTRLEQDILDRFYTRYRECGFPTISKLRFLRREVTEAGQFTYIDSDAIIRGLRGREGLGRFSQIEVDGLTAGASVFLQITNGKIDYLEITVNGAERWPRRQSAWIILDPDTGDRPRGSASR